MKLEKISHSSKIKMIKMSVILPKMLLKKKQAFLFILSSYCDCPFTIYRM